MLKIKRFEFNMFPVNCYVLWDETKEAVIIDPGILSEKEEQTLKDFVQSNELTIKHLLLTHLHLDHIAGVPFVEKTFGVKAEAHPLDAFWVDEAPGQSRLFGFPLKEQPAVPSLHLADGQKVTFGNTVLECIHVPGHSPGSVCFWNAMENVLFSGDVLFQGSIGRADLKKGNFDLLIEGICSRLLTLPTITLVYPGHGAPTTIGVEKHENPFFRL